MKASSAVAVFGLQVSLAATSWQFCAAQNPLAALENEAKEKAAEVALTKVLNDNLPLTLDAKDVYPTVTTLPGGPFSPTPLKLTADQLDQPLPPGDYTINTLDFCSQYSIHEPGAGLAYVLGPYEGKAAGAIGALIWRGTEQYGINPNSLQAVSWTIQSGLTYDQMPKSYQAIVDQVIPDYKNEITGDFVTNLESTYNSLAKAASLPPLDTILAKLGAPGQLALDAERQRQILTAQNTNDQIMQQTLFQGQESGIYTPVKVENGPWTERVAGQVYMKLLISGGNMTTTNVMQIRVMPSPTANARVQVGGPRQDSGAPRLVQASYGGAQVTPAMDNAPITVTNLMEGTLGYSQGQGAQALGQVPVVARGGPIQGSPAPPPPVQASNPPPQNLCPPTKNPAKPLNISFTSYTSAISDVQLAQDYLGLYDAGLNSSGAASDGSFAQRMDQIAAAGVPVRFVVVNGDDPQFSGLQNWGQAAYINAQGSDPTILVPNPDEFAMTLPVSQDQGGGYEVVISQQALMNGYYSPINNVTSTGLPDPSHVPQPVPIQMPMAYELGTNVYNLAVKNLTKEQMKGPATNDFISKEFPLFDKNKNQQTAAIFYGDVPNPCQAFTAKTRGIYDLQNAGAFGKMPGNVVAPANSYMDATCSLSTNVVPAYIPKDDPPAGTPNPPQCPAAQ
jgi:hypothetical protein